MKKAAPAGIVAQQASCSSVSPLACPERSSAPLSSYCVATQPPKLCTAARLPDRPKLAPTLSSTVKVHDRSMPPRIPPAGTAANAGSASRAGCRRCSRRRCGRARALFNPARPHCASYSTRVYPPLPRVLAALSSASRQQPDLGVVQAAEGAIQSGMAFFEGLVQRCVGGVERVYVWSNRQPWLTLRRVLWVFPLGLGLAALYLVLTGVMLASIVFAPFAYQTFRMALLALDGGITLEPFSQYVVLSLEVRGRSGGTRKACSCPSRACSCLRVVSVGGPGSGHRLPKLPSLAAGAGLGQPRASVHDRRQRRLGSAVWLAAGAGARDGRRAAGAHDHRRRHRADAVAARSLRHVSAGARVLRRHGRSGLGGWERSCGAWCSC